LLTLLTFYFVLFTDFFDISNVEVIDNKKVTSDEILQKSRLKNGQSIFRFNKNQVENIIEKIPYIKSASLVRVFPNTIKIYIEEREAIGAAFYENQFIFVDSQNIILEVSDKLIDTNIPILTAIENNLGAIVIGDELQIKPEWLKKELFNILNLLKERELLNHLSEVNITKENIFHLYTKGGSVIKVRNSDIVKEKLDFIRTYLLEKDERMIIDLTHGGNPTYIPR